MVYIPGAVDLQTNRQADSTEADLRFAQSFEKLVAGFKDIHTCKIENYGGK